MEKLQVIDSTLSTRARQRLLLFIFLFFCGTVFGFFRGIVFGFFSGIVFGFFRGTVFGFCYFSVLWKVTERPVGF